jgi:DNA-binding transcriptional LysR family regulator
VHLDLRDEAAERPARGGSSILRELEDANVALAGARGAPGGKLRENAPSVFGRFLIAPALPRFLADHPDLSDGCKLNPLELFQGRYGLRAHPAAHALLRPAPF